MRDCLDPEARRLAYAAACLDQHATRELYLLELAVLSPDDDAARRLELYADVANRDAQAIAEEHGLEL